MTRSRSLINLKVLLKQLNFWMIILFGIVIIAIGYVIVMFFPETTPSTGSHKITGFIFILFGLLIIILRLFSLIYDLIKLNRSSINSNEDFEWINNYEGAPMSYEMATEMATLKPSDLIIFNHNYNYYPMVLSPEELNGFTITPPTYDEVFKNKLDDRRMTSHF